MRRDRNRLNSGGSFSAKYILPRSFVKLAWRRNSMVELSFQAKQRLAFLEFYQVVKDVSLTCKLFKISRQTFYKWRQRYDSHNLASLEDLSKAPQTKRKGILTLQQESNIIKLRKRKENLRLGKLKLAILYQQEYGEKISSWQIQKVIEKHGLYYDSLKAKKIRTKKRKSWGQKKIKINEVNPQDYLTKDKPFFFCLDCIVLYLPWGMKRYILTAIDYFHKLAYSRVYRTKASSNAFGFLLRLNLLTEGKIAAVLSDNGGEWKKYFESACQRLKIAHIWTRLRTPKDNSVNERFNRTLQEEFMATDEYFEEYLLEKDLIKANQTLTEWLIFYNFKRPHQTLNYQTPIDYTYYTKGVSAMYPSRTSSVNPK
jgi:transposase InsO family protein